MSRRSYTPNSGYQLLGDGSTISDADYLLLNQTPFNTRVVSEETPQVVLKATLPLSEIRDTFTNVVDTTSEYIVGNGSTGGSLATKQLGDYIPGQVLKPGLGVRVEEMNGGVVEWGYFDDDNGVFWRYNTSGLFIVRRKAGVDEVTPQSEFNFDTVNGSGPSKHNLDMSDGYIFQIPFTYYGYGDFNFTVGIPDTSGRRKQRLVHSLNATGETSLEQPNLPITVRTEGEAVCYVAGRQITSVGKLIRPFRPVSYLRESASVGTTRTPLQTVRMKEDLKYIYTEFSGIDVIGGAVMEIEIIRNATISEEAFVSAPGYLETAVEWQPTTTISGGDVIYRRLAGSDTQANRVASATIGLPDIPLLNGNTYTYTARSLGTATTVNFLGTVRENW